MIVDITSDLHGHFPVLKGGDLLIIAGDLTARDSIDEHVQFLRWASHQDYRKVVYIAGNHDMAIEDAKRANNILFHPSYPFSENQEKIVYLCDSGTEFEGLKIWGSPWTTTFVGINPKCTAFTVETDEELAEKWELIPLEADILITHSPPYGMFDNVQRMDKDGKSWTECVGSKGLLTKSLETRARLHVFGHIHEHGGSQTTLSWEGNDEYSKCIFANASLVNERYQPVHKAIRFIL